MILEKMRSCLNWDQGSGLMAGYVFWAWVTQM